MSLSTFPNLFIVAVHYTYQHMPCMVDCTHVHHVAVHYTYQHMPCMVDCTHVHHVVHYTTTTISCCYVDYTCRVSYSLIQGLVTVAQKTPPTKQQMFGKGSVTASFGLGNSFPGMTTSQTKH